MREERGKNVERQNRSSNGIPQMNRWQVKVFDPHFAVECVHLRIHRSFSDFVTDDCMIIVSSYTACMPDIIAGHARAKEDAVNAYYLVVQAPTVYFLECRVSPITIC